MSNINKNDETQRIAKVVEKRTMPGSEKIISGWQNYLADILTRMDGYLLPGRLITFQHMLLEERRFFETLHASVAVPDTVRAIYLPHSVILDMMAAHPDAGTDNLPRKNSDTGIVLAARKRDCNIILNAVFALPPVVPAIDIYENGRLLAGYMYHTTEECIQDLAGVMRTYLKHK